MRLFVVVQADPSKDSFLADLLVSRVPQPSAVSDSLSAWIQLSFRTTVLSWDIVGVGRTERWFPHTGFRYVRGRRSVLQGPWSLSHSDGFFGRHFLFESLWKVVQFNRPRGVTCASLARLNSGFVDVNCFYPSESPPELRRENNSFFCCVTRIGCKRTPERWMFLHDLGVVRAVLLMRHFPQRVPDSPNQDPQFSFIDHLFVAVSIPWENKTLCVPD